jgi:hypothetical protein
MTNFELISPCFYFAQQMHFMQTPIINSFAERSQSAVMFDPNPTRGLHYSLTTLQRFSDQWSA